jgi:DNA-binding PadR family transcriptional regulator
MPESDLNPSTTIAEHFLGRSARKYYTLTTSGRATLEASEKRYALLANLIPANAGEKA